MRAQVLRDLLRLPVTTESGEFLGRVSDVELELESASVRAYLVSPSFVKGLFTSEQYIITPSQVVSISADKMIVKDGVVGEKETPRRNLQQPLPQHPTPLTKQEE
ncbi:MAG: PRC-barrel domain-containing protein [Patescibacteria group bacterium]